MSLVLVSLFTLLCAHDTILFLQHVLCSSHICLVLIFFWRRERRGCLLTEGMTTSTRVCTFLQSGLSHTKQTHTRTNPWRSTADVVRKFDCRGDENHQQNQFLLVEHMSKLMQEQESRVLSPLLWCASTAQPGK